MKAADLVQLAATHYRKSACSNAMTSVTLYMASGRSIHFSSCTYKQGYDSVMMKADVELGGN